MKLSYNLLKTYVDFKESPEQLAQLLTERAFEVEGVEHIQPLFSGIVAAKVTRIEAHPQADRLRVITLDAGKKTVSPVVCGAFNFSIGDIVPLALPGATLPDGQGGIVTLEKATIRGIESQGMICAGEELGLTEPSGKKEIIVLDSSTKPGTALDALFPKDSILEISLPANRPDLYSYLGIARELRAILHKKTDTKKPVAIKPSGKPAHPVVISTKDTCTKFIAVEMHVQVASSPGHIQTLLSRLGMRPINNVVDITNLVTAETGQPLHAFHEPGVQGALRVRMAKKGETLTALNHKAYHLQEDAMVIADDTKALDVAGIMGGLETEITDATNKIILTASLFNGSSIYRTSKKLGLTSPASILFAKGIHPYLLDLGTQRAIALLEQYARAKVSAIQVYNVTRVKPVTIQAKTHDINTLLGTNLAPKAIQGYLKHYGISITGNEKFSAIPPWWRTDLTSTADLAEDVLRLHGYNTVAPEPPPFTPPPVLKDELETQTYESKLFWASLGYSEAQNYSFVSEQDIITKGALPKDHIQISNPLSQEQGYLRKDLLTGLIKTIARNEQQDGELQFVEIGKIYDGFEREPLLLAGVVASKEQNSELFVRRAFGDIVQYAQRLGFRNIVIEAPNTIVIDGKKCGKIELVSRSILKRFALTFPVVYFELKLDELFKNATPAVFQAFSKYQKTQRDISFVIQQDIPWSNIAPVFQASPLVTDVQVIESASQSKALEFHKKLAEKGLKNLGVRLVLQASDRTLTDQEITGILEQIMIKLKEKFKVEIR